MGLSNLFGLLQKSSFKVALRIPRIKLPKLALPALLVYSVPKLGLPSFGSLLGKLGSIGSGLLGSLTPFQQKLSSMFGSISNLNSGSALGFAKSVLNSAYKDVSNLATGLIRNALAGATAAVNSVTSLVNGIANTVSNIDQAVVSEINKVSQLFKTQTKNIKDLVQGEINVASGNTKTIAQVSAVQASFTKTITQSTSNLTNAQIKKLQEDPNYNKEFTSNVTQQAINNAAQAVVDKNNSINNAVMQSSTVTNLGSAPIAPPLIVNTLTPTTTTTAPTEIIGGEIWSPGIPLSINQLITIRNDLSESSFTQYLKSNFYSAEAITQYNKQFAAGQVPTQ